MTTMVAEVKRAIQPERGQWVEVVRKDHTGHILRISRYLFKHGVQKPISEKIFDSEGKSTLYVYNETGESVKQVIRFD